MSIIPSMPTLSTPDFSATASPSAAIAIGTIELDPDHEERQGPGPRSASMFSGYLNLITWSPSRAHEGGDHDLHHYWGQSGAGLKAVRAHSENCEEPGTRQLSTGVEPCDERNADAEETQVRGEVCERE